MEWSGPVTWALSEPSQAGGYRFEQPSGVASRERRLPEGLVCPDIRGNIRRVSDGKLLGESLDQHQLIVVDVEGVDRTVRGRDPQGKNGKVHGRELRDRLEPVELSQHPGNSLPGPEQHGLRDHESEAPIGIVEDRLTVEAHRKGPAHIL